MFVYMWEFIIKENKKKEFLHYYGPEGKWSNLFKKSNGYFKTELLKDIENSLHFITIDYWQSKKELDMFIQKYIDEYKKIDKVCMNFTASERIIGNFEL